MLTLPILFGIIMAAIDGITLPIIKTIHSTGMSFAWMTIPLIIYAAQPLLFYSALNYTSMAQMNVLWDISSDIMVSLIGILYFREKLTNIQGIGILVGIIAIGLIGG